MTKFQSAFPFESMNQGVSPVRLLSKMVGMAGFEPTTSCTTSKRAKPGCATPRHNQTGASEFTKSSEIIMGRQSQNPSSKSSTGVQVLNTCSQTQIEVHSQFQQVSRLRQRDIYGINIALRATDVTEINSQKSQFAETCPLILHCHLFHPSSAGFDQNRRTHYSI